MASGNPAPDFCPHGTVRSRCVVCLRERVAELERLVEALAERCRLQSELLSRRAERPAGEG